MLWRVANSRCRLPATHVIVLFVAAALVCVATMAALFGPVAVFARTAHESSARATDAPQQPGVGGCGWSHVSSPNLNQYNALNAVAAIAGNNVWAVGSRGDSFTGEETMVQRWNGSAWSVVSSPNPSPNGNELLGVTALSANDIWAAGYYRSTTSGGPTQTFILHWDGSNWTHVASPSPASIENQLYDIEAVSANDIWAVGHTWNVGARRRTLILHWDGAQWTNIPSPSVGAFDNYLTSVDALSANDVWAVGQYVSSSGAHQTLALHWDGSNWSVVPTPNAQSVNNHLNGVAMVSPNEGWAVGYTCPGNCFGSNAPHLLLMRWNGTQWSIVPSPLVNMAQDELNDVVALSANDVWAVGEYSTGTQAAPLAMHWDGTQWSVVPAPSPTPTSPEFYSVSAVSSSDIWAVGFFHYPGNPVFRTLTQHYSGPCSVSSPTPTLPTATSTPMPPTSTATALPPSASPTGMATGSPTAPLATFTSTPASTSTSTPPATQTSTATMSPATSTTTAIATVTAVATAPPATPTLAPCDLAFVDVPTEHTFYPFVRCLACRGVLGGYSDGTFRPGNEVTRGQLAKIVANAAGFDEPVSGQTFSDVEPGSAFYEHIERMARRGIIGGYSDGTFRPNNTATRGQISKIVSNAADFKEPVSRQTFRDVPPTHTFYEHIERIASRGIIGGYSDGTFRPQNNATRGQTSKIVSNTFFPECQPSMIR